MYCPNCRSEFEGESEVCPNCNLPLRVELDEPEAGETTGGERPVRDIQPYKMVFETSDLVVLESATALLEGASIPFAVVNEGRVGLQPSQVLVPDEYARDVQELLSRQAEDVDDR